MVWGLGFRIQALGFRVWNLGVRVYRVCRDQVAALGDVPLGHLLGEVPLAVVWRGTREQGSGIRALGRGFRGQGGREEGPGFMPCHHSPPEKCRLQ